MRFALCSLLIATACTTNGNDDVVGPFTGPTHRYVVDQFLPPTTNTLARATGDDLDGDGFVDNQLGMVMASLASSEDTTKNGADMIAAGALASSLEIIADDPLNDPSVGVAYYGSAGDPVTLAGGTLTNGAFASNRTATTEHPGHAIIRVPMFQDADPSMIDVSNLELDLQPDGHGGYDGFVRGTVDAQATVKEAYRGAVQMLAADPDGHLTFLQIFDKAPRDWTMTESEFTTNSLITSLFTPDVTLHGQMALSVGFRIHVKPCDDGRCQTTPPADSCHDRERDGNETDVDCGGSCGACAGGATCTANTDCQSESCTSAGTCAAPSCTDGVRDGYETDVDCGSACGATCKVGQRCHSDTDCEPTHTCGPVCTDPSCPWPPYWDTCR